ncbi:hypothetical protein [Clostridium botulinum]|uniref:hypothetical protein n=1 Tax=Clostridium botulinum TaxID=1491 RepID=UPI0007749412|nr:hypothetical protein [Clostridium botulinum]APH20908.1 hypothetical protein NPD1_4170 [Clostridium botulinum]APQ71149.1 hypothetical protein RSJ8_4127 [Clostridium botulinum]MBN3379263.1 hypothetical protein [Clostridium botulinum]
MNKIFETTGINEKQLTLYILCKSKEEVNKFSNFLWEDRRKGDIIEYDIEDNCCYQDDNNKYFCKPFKELIKSKRLDLHKEYNKPIVIHSVYADLK